MNSFKFLGLLVLFGYALPSAAWVVRKISANGQSAKLEMEQGDSLEGLDQGGIGFFRTSNNKLVRFIIRRVVPDGIIVTSKRYELKEGAKFRHEPNPSLEEVKGTVENERIELPSVLSVGFKPGALLDKTWRFGVGFKLNDAFEATGDLGFFTSKNEGATISARTRGTVFVPGVNWYFAEETFYGVYTGVWVAAGTMNTEFQNSNTKSTNNSTVLAVGPRIGYRLQTSFRLFLAAGLSPGIWSAKTNATVNGQAGYFRYRRILDWGADELLTVGVVF
jgi:hypothetical protein